MLQSFQNDLTQEHFYSYEVLDSQCDIIEGRLFYNFKKPNQDLDEWNAFTSDNGLDSSINVTIIK